MRHRKVLNLYDTDQGHEDLLVYLEGIEGSTRQQQALVQMVMVGFRVIAAHESGDEAYFGVRNPDVRAARKAAPPRLPSRPRRETPVIEAPAVSEENAEAEIRTDQPLSHPGHERHMQPVADSPPSHGYQEQASQEDEYNTLEILRLMDKGED